MVNPKVKKRLINSLDYLRKMNFFKDYSNLTSEEILEKIFSGEIGYKNWWGEKEEEENSIYIPPRGVLLKESIEDFQGCP
ncbi:MAG: hypothetical protein FGF48_03675 [Candidatus Brockarchaeota archaeon]|nr:hypothetical protein [Candidatus Brockarchaeota archaeon]